jgi:hypothetical protein
MSSPPVRQLFEHAAYHIDHQRRRRIERFSPQ